MSDLEVNLIIGLAGIAATLTASCLGLYFASKARSRALAETLFARQLDLISRVIHKQSRMRVFLTILKGDNDIHRCQAREDIRTCFREFSELEEESSAILPTELWVEIKKLSEQASEMLIVYDERGDIEDQIFRSFVARMTKVALLSRSVVGVDELTQESLSLFASTKQYERLANLDIAQFEEIYDKANKDA
jgi:hypothetical protein